MNNTNDSKYQVNKRYSVALRSLFAVLKHKVNENTSFTFQKMQYIWLNKSPQVMTMRCGQIRKKLSKLVTLKMRLYWTTFTSNLTLIDLQKRQKHMGLLKLKDRAYQAKVKSLRVLSRQWKQKKSQSQYKNKYFTPKLQQTPKMIKQKVSQQFYLTLRNILRNKYLTFFNAIKSSQVIKVRNLKGLYLANYLMSKRRYWLMFGYERLRLNVLVNRERKNKGEIESLEGRLVPVQDAEVVNLKEKQEKLQTALNGVLKQKQQVVTQVDKQTAEMQQKIQQKQKQLTLLQQQKQSLNKQLEARRQSTSNYEFTRNQIFYYIYMNFLINLRVWSQMESIDLGNIFLNKALVLEWLQCPVVDFDLDKVGIGDKQVEEMVKELEAVVKEYKRLRGNSDMIEWNDVFQQHFSGCSANMCNNFEELSAKIKFTSKMLSETVNENAEVINKMLHTIQNYYTKLTENQSFQVLEY